MDLPNFARHLILQFYTVLLIPTFIDLIFILYYHILKYGIGYYWSHSLSSLGNLFLINIYFFNTDKKHLAC